MKIISVSQAQSNTITDLSQVEKHLLLCSTHITSFHAKTFLALMLAVTATDEQYTCGLGPISGKKELQDTSQTPLRYI